MPSTDREIFSHLSGDPHSLQQVDMLAFALFFFEKEEWCQQFERKTGSPPAQTDIDRFTEDYTDERLKRLKADAISFFDAAAREYLADEMEADRKKVMEDSVVKEVRRAGSFWRQFGMAVITSILAPLVLALLLLLGAYVKYIPSPSDIASKVFNPISGTQTK